MLFSDMYPIFGKTFTSTREKNQTEKPKKIQTFILQNIIYVPKQKAITWPGVSNFHVLVLRLFHRHVWFTKDFGADLVHHHKPVSKTYRPKTGILIL